MWKKSQFLHQVLHEYILDNISRTCWSISDNIAVYLSKESKQIWISCMHLRIINNIRDNLKYTETQKQKRKQRESTDKINHVANIHETVELGQVWILYLLTVGRKVSDQRKTPTIYLFIYLFIQLIPFLSKKSPPNMHHSVIYFSRFPSSLFE